MKKNSLKLLTAVLALCFAFLSVSCRQHDEFSFSGTIVGYEICQSMNDFAYLVSLESPAGLGDSIMIVEDSTCHGNVIAIYQSPKLLKIGRHIDGTIYLNNNFNAAHCYRHYTYRDLATGEEITLQQAIFVKVNMY